MIKNKPNNNEFELSVLGGFGIAAVIALGIRAIMAMPFNIMLETTYIKYHKVLGNFVYILRDLVPSGIGIIVLLKMIRQDLQPNFKIKYTEKINFKIVLCTIFFILGYCLWYRSSIGVMITKIPLSKDCMEIIKEDAKQPYLNVIITQVIIAPIFEEIVFRGVILEGFLNKYKKSTAIIVSSIIFGVSHLNIPQFITAIIAGIFLGIVYYKTKSVVLCIVFHLLVNASSFLVLVIEPNIMTFFIGIVIFIISVIFFEKYIRSLNYNHTNEIGSSTQ